VLRPAPRADAAEVLAHAKTHLAAYKCPRIVYLVDDLPRTRNGKLRRAALDPALARALADDHT
jgi:acyl-coenzyme A synthetase/AMP-(fatty) acid ligase